MTYDRDRWILMRYLAFAAALHFILAVLAVLKLYSIASECPQIVLALCASINFATGFVCLLAPVVISKKDELERR